MDECARCRNALSARHDGQATDLDDAVMRRHLGACAQCLMHDSELGRLDTLARNAVLATTSGSPAALMAPTFVLPDLAELVGRVALGLVAVFHILRCLSDINTGLSGTGMHGAEGAIWGLSFAGLLLLATVRPRTAPTVAMFATIELVVMALTHHDAIHSHLGLGAPTVSVWLGSHVLELLALGCLLAVTWRVSRHSWRPLL